MSAGVIWTVIVPHVVFSSLYQKLTAVTRLYGSWECKTSAMFVEAQ